MRPRLVRQLKRDALGRVELLDGPAGRVVRRVACGGPLPGSRLVARWLMARERRALEHLAGVHGIAQLLDLPEYASVAAPGGPGPRPRDVLLRTWLEGEPLYLVSALPADFFERLTDLVGEMHARGVCHNDLHKEPNVLVGDDGYPRLVDFQLASVHPRSGKKFEIRRAEDLRHVDKHHARYRAHGSPTTVHGPPAPRARSRTSDLWRRFGKPAYNLLTRKLLRRSDAEGRRPRGGPWPAWTDPVGPRRAR